jgi:hypothetical protein
MGSSTTSTTSTSTLSSKSWLPPLLLLVVVVCCCSWIQQDDVDSNNYAAVVVVDAFTTTTIMPSTRQARRTRNENHHHHHLLLIDWRLNMATVEESSSSSSSSSSIKNKNSNKTPLPPPPSNEKVIYQKVIRPPPGDIPDVLFLSYLIEYLENYYKLPTNLPMVYETHGEDQDQDQDPNTTGSNRCLFAWDSPLSPSSEATRMEVEVVGIYTNNNKKKKKDTNQQQTRTVPNMAMVVVRKSNIDKMNAATIPPMMSNLFTTSEKLIVQSLDRGLDDFMNGKINIKLQLDDNDDDDDDDDDDTRLKSTAPSTNYQSVQQVLDAEIVPDDVDVDDDDEDDAMNDGSIKSKHNIKELAAAAAAATTTTLDMAARRERAMATMKVPADISTTKNNTKNSKLDASDDVKGDVPAQLKQNNTKVTKPTATTNENIEDYAVAAARLASKLRKQSQSNIQKQPLKKEEDYAVAAARKVAATSTKTKNDNSKQQHDHDHNHNISTEPVNDVAVVDMKNYAQESKSEFVEASIIEKRNLNVRLVDEKESEDPGIPMAGDVNKKKEELQEAATTTQDEIEMKNFKQASKVLDDLASQGTDMSPEDLLRDILKFDEEQKKEEQPGTGFVSGAFEKAKELLQDRNQQQQTKSMNGEVGVKERVGSTTLPGLKKNFEDMTPEEQLKAMFAAGQQMADGRITERLEKSQGSNVGMQRKQATEEDVDELIAREKSISGHARILDEELAELELYINPTPGEEWDGPMQNPLFDIMSGPEVYNPNVELDTVNYPGALPGTKEVKLPKQLDEAVKQAQFAAAVLENLKIVEKKDENGRDTVQYLSGNKELTAEQVETLQKIVTEASEIGIINDPINLMAERSRLQLILDELWNQPEERFQEIASNYKDLLLSDNFVRLVRERLALMVERDLEALRRDDESLKEPHERERMIIGRLVNYAQLLVKEARALGAELEAQQLEIIRSICKVAMDPSHTTEEETAMALSDAVRDMRPLLDDVFVAYLKYAVAEEESRLARAGILDDPDYNQWLFVLKIVQQGVYAEIAKGINRYIEHIWYVLRMETPRQRRRLLEMLVDDMPTMDVRPFVQVVDNIVCSLGDGTKGEFDGVVPLGEMTNKLLQLHRDLKEVLPPERIALKSRDADEWAARQKKLLLEQRKLGEQRLQAAKDVEHREDEIEAFGAGEIVDRFD